MGSPHSFSLLTLVRGGLALTKERVEDVVFGLGQQVAEELGYELVEVEYKKEGADWVLRCLIDCPDGVGVDECQRFSQLIEQALDAADPIPGSYLLEVSSPGIERPLKKAADFQRFAQSQIELRLHHAVDGQKKYRGLLLGLDPTTQIVRLQLADKVAEIPWKDIAKANLSADFFGFGGGKK